MAREIDDKKKRKALRKLRKAAARAEAEGGPGLSDWEKEFVEEVEARVEKYGSAFADPDKGKLDEPLSALQTRKLKEIDKKSRGKQTSFKQRSGFKSKGKKAFSPRVRDIHSDVEEEPAASPPPPIPPKGSLPKLVRAADLLPDMPVQDTTPRIDAPRKRPAPPFKVIKGGKDS